MLTRVFKKVIICKAILIFSFIIVSCKDEPLEPAIDHFEAEGIVFYDSGIKIGEIFRGVTQDTLFARVGQTSSHIEVKFYDSNKNEIDPPDHKKQPFAWEIQDTTILGIWQHPGEEGSYEFHLVGKNVGITNIEFFVMHEGHADIRTGKIPVKINE
jgi:hypothetical protein